MNRDVRLDRAVLNRSIAGGQANQLGTLRASSVTVVKHLLLCFWKFCFSLDAAPGIFSLQFCFGGDFLPQWGVRLGYLGFWRAGSRGCGRRQMGFVPSPFDAGSAWDTAPRVSSAWLSFVILLGTWRTRAPGSASHEHTCQEAWHDGIQGWHLADDE